MRREHRGRALRLLLVAAVLGSCGDQSPPLDPGGLARFRIAMQISETGGGVTDAFDRVDRIFVRFVANDEVRFEDELPFDPTGSESRVPVQVPLRAAAETFQLQVELRSAGAALFSGGGVAELVAGSESTVETSLEPVIAGVACAGEPVGFVSYRQVVNLRGTALFATGDTIPQAQLTWTSSDDRIATVNATGDVTAVGDGEAQITCAGGGFSDSRRVAVFARVSSVDVAPPAATAAVGASVTFTATLRDAGNNLITAPRTVIWASSNTEVATVGATGVALAMRAGTSSISAAVGDVSDSGLLTVVAAPTVVTLDATLIESMVAVNGRANPLGSATEAWFEWGSDANLADAQSTQPRSIGAGNEDVAFRDTFSDLDPGGTYFFRAVARNAVGTARGAILSFVVPAPPSVRTAAATITGRQVELRGFVNPEGLAADAWFEWGSDPQLSEAATSEPQPVGAGNSEVAVSEVPGGLAAGVTYYFRVVATNAIGTTQGAILPFSIPLPPTVQTSQAVVSGQEVELRGSVNPEGAATEAWFEWGIDRTLTTSQSTQPQQVGAGNIAVAITGAPGQLVPGTTYFFRAVARNAVGTARGAILSFVVPAPPSVRTAAATITGRQVELRGFVNPEGFATDAWFEWGSDPQLSEAETTEPQPVGAGAAEVAVSEIPSELAAGVTYYFRVVATNAIGRSEGTILPFSIPLPPTVQTSQAVVSGQEVELRGSVNPEGAATEAWFEWGTDQTLTTSQRTQPQQVGAGNIAVAITGAPGQLVPGTIYFFRAVASNATGTTRGAILSFSLQPPPTVQTLRSSVNDLEVNIFGSVNPHGAATRAWFEWGIDPLLATSSTTQAQAVAPEEATFTISDVVADILPSTTYYFRAVAENEGGTSRGGILSFQTPGPPAARTLEDTFENGRIVLHAMVNPYGWSTEVYFEMALALGVSFPLIAHIQPIPAGFEEVPVSYEVGELMYGTLYYFRVVARNGEGESTGENLTFTTPASPGTE